MMKALVPLSAIQKKAKQLQKEKSLKWHQALNEAAIFHGFANYKNYQNTANLYRQSQEARNAQGFERIMQEKQEIIGKKLYEVDLLIKNFNLPIQELLGNLEKSKNSKQVMRSLCEKSTLKEYMELNLLRHFLEEDDFDDQYHIAKEVSLKNLRYKLGKDMLCVEGEYDLKLQFGFDHDQDEKIDLFNDVDMYGSFELTVHCNKDITFENLEIGWDI